MSTSYGASRARFDPLHPSPASAAARRAVVDLLRECHGRIRTFMALAIAVAERDDMSPADVVDICVRVERWFRMALPLHTMDEDESLRPRLLGKTTGLDATLACMDEQHAVHDELVRRLVPATAALRRAPRDPNAAAALRAVARPLRDVLEPHLQLEEAVIFPAVVALVDDVDQRAIVREMTARRRDWGDRGPHAGE